jgi:hypothetical protein
MKLARYIIINGIFVFSLYFGYLKEVENARLLANFFIWACIILSAAPFMMDDKYKITAGEKGFSVPIVVDFIFDCLIASFLIYLGFWITGFLYLLHAFSMDKFKRDSLALYQKSKIQVKEEKNLNSFSL